MQQRPHAQIRRFCSEQHLNISDIWYHEFMMWQHCSTSTIWENDTYSMVSKWIADCENNNCDGPEWRVVHCTSGNQCHKLLVTKPI